MRTLFFTCKKCGMTVDDGSPIQKLCMDCSDSIPALLETDSTIEKGENKNDR